MPWRRVGVVLVVARIVTCVAAIGGLWDAVRTLQVFEPPLETTRCVGLVFFKALNALGFQGLVGAALAVHS